MLQEMIQKAVQKKASDIHITYGTKPFFRINGILYGQNEFEEITDEMLLKYIKEVLSNKDFEKLVKDKQIDLAIDTQWTRCRINIFMQRGHYDLALRLINYEIKSLDELGLNPVLKELADLNSGLVLITGVTGSGKSTTLAGMIDYINSNYSKNIITLEEPIEYIHKFKKSIVRQREVGVDVLSFPDGLRSALREDPDVILIGEMRELETISTAITLAETGHLVLGTLHTRSAVETIERIIDVFPANQQQQIRIQLCNVLEGIVSQILLPQKTGNMIASLEIVRMTTSIRNMIRWNENISKIKDDMFFDKNKLGNQTMTQDLVKLYKNGKINKETALKYCYDEELFNKLINVSMNPIH